MPTKYYCIAAFNATNFTAASGVINTVQNIAPASSPTFTGHLAETLVALAEGPVPGILHVAARDQCSWFEFAQEIVSASNHVCEVRPGRTEERRC